MRTRLCEWVVQPGLPDLYDHYSPDLTGVGHAGTVELEFDFIPPRRAFNIGFEGANPGPSRPEPKARFRRKAGSLPI